MRRLLFLLLLLPTILCAVWSDNPSQNNPIAVTTGDQVQPKAAAASDGSFYISWFDTRNGNYDLYLQHLSEAGDLLWQVNGIAVSTHPTMTWTTDYDLAADNSGDAVASFQDIRHDATNNITDIFAYNIASDQTFNWGADGLSLSNDANFEARPKIAVTPENHVVIVWPNMPDTGNYTVKMQRIAPDGTLEWGEGITISGTENYANPMVISTDTENVIVGWFKQTGTFPAVTRNIYAQSFDASGSAVWTQDAAISTQDHIAYFHDFNMTRDDAGGALFAWGDDRDTDNYESAWVQGVLSDGSLRFDAGGVECSTQTQRNRYYPYAVANTQGVFCFWVEKNGNQDLAGLYAQRFAENGARVWGNNGAALVDLFSGDVFAPIVQPLTEDVVAFYMDYSTANPNNQQVKAIRVNPQGAPVWTGGSVTLSSVSSNKDDIVATGFSGGQAVAAWYDERDGDGGSIYAQNISEDGVLGPVQLTPSVTITSPLDGAVIATHSFNLVFAVENFTGGTIQIYRNETLLDSMTLPQPFFLENVPDGQQTFRVDLVDTQSSTVASDQVTVTVMTPAVTITSPVQNAVVTTLPLTVQFSAELPPACTVWASLNDGTPTQATAPEYVLNGLPEGANTLVLHALQADQTTFDPDVADTLHFTYQTSTVEDPNQSPWGPLTVFGTVGNPSANPGLSYAIGRSGPVALEVYNLKGQRVRSLREITLQGRRTMVWNGLDEQGRAVASGVYLYRVSANGKTVDGRWMLIR
jgi:hypothetical protein